MEAKVTANSLDLGGSYVLMLLFLKAGLQYAGRKLGGSLSYVDGNSSGLRWLKEPESRQMLILCPIVFVITLTCCIRWLPILIGIYCHCPFQYIQLEMWRYFYFSQEWCIRLLIPLICWVKHLKSAMQLHTNPHQIPVPSLLGSMGCYMAIEISAVPWVYNPVL